MQRVPTVLAQSCAVVVLLGCGLLGFRLGEERSTRPIPLDVLREAAWQAFDPADASFRVDDVVPDNHHNVHGEFDPDPGGTRWAHHAVARGRAVVPQLRESLRADDPYSTGEVSHEHAVRVWKAVVDASDLDFLGPRAVAGDDYALEVVCSLRNAQSVDVILEVLAMHGLSEEMADVLENHLHEERVVDALIAWFEAGEARPNRFSGGLGRCGTLLSRSWDPRVVPVLLELLRHHVGAEFAKSLLLHGSGARAELWIEVMYWGAHEYHLDVSVRAAHRLNALAGEPLFRMPDTDGHSARIAALEEAVPRARKWWAANRHRPEFQRSPAMLRVLDAGVAVRGAGVRSLELAGHDPRWAHWATPVEPTVESDEEGLALLSLSSSGGWFLVTRGERAALWYRPAWMTGTATVELEDGARVEGVVHDHHLHESAMPRLELRFPVPDARGSDHYSAGIRPTVDEDGRFVSPPLPVSLGRVTTAVSGPGLSWTHVEVELGSGKVPTIVARAAPRLRGRVVASDGREVEGLRLVFGSRRRYCRWDFDLDAGGEFELWGAWWRPAALVTVVSERHAPVELTLGEFPDDGVLDVGEVVLPVGRTLRGYVRTPDDLVPIRGRAVLRSLGGAVTRSVELHPSGAFVFRHLGTGTHWLHVVPTSAGDVALPYSLIPPAPVRELDRRKIEIGAGDPDPIAFEVSPQGVRVRLRDAVGRPFVPERIDFEVFHLTRSGAAWESVGHVAFPPCAAVPELGPPHRQTQSEFPIGRCPSSGIGLVIRIPGLDPIVVDLQVPDDDGELTIDVVVPR